MPVMVRPASRSTTRPARTIGRRSGWARPAVMA